MPSEGSDDSIAIATAMSVAVTVFLTSVQRKSFPHVMSFNEIPLKSVFLLSPHSEEGTEAQSTFLC